MSQDVMVHFGRLVRTLRRYMNSRFQIQTVVAQRSESHAMILEGQMFSFALAVSWIEFRKTMRTISLVMLNVSKDALSFKEFIFCGMCV